MTIEETSVALFDSINEDSDMEVILTIDKGNFFFVNEELFTYDYKKYFLKCNDIELQQYEISVWYMENDFSDFVPSEIIGITISYTGEYTFDCEEEYFDNCMEDLVTIRAIFLKWYELKESQRVETNLQIETNLETQKLGNPRSVNVEVEFGF